MQWTSCLTTKRMSDQQKLIRHLAKHPVRGPAGFEGWLADAYETALGFDRILAEKNAATRKARLWTEFSKADEELRKRGCLRIFEIVDRQSYVFRTPCLSDDVFTHARRFTYEDRHRVVAWIDTLTHRKFEYLGAALAWFLGAEKAAVTSGGNDGGVDFYALMPSWGASGIVHSPQKYLKVVGQSKYYDGTVGVDTAKLLIKTVEDIRSYTVEMAPRLPDWFAESRGPVVGLIVSPFGFQAGAVTKAHWNGVMLADGIDVAEAITASRRYRKERARGSSPIQIMNDGLQAVGFKS
jgi:hypothetical protein